MFDKSIYIKFIKRGRGEENGCMWIYISFVLCNSNRDSQKQKKTHNQWIASNIAKSSSALILLKANAFNNQSNRTKKKGLSLWNCIEVSFFFFIRPSAIYTFCVTINWTLKINKKKRLHQLSVGIYYLFILFKKDTKHLVIFFFFF